MTKEESVDLIRGFAAQPAAVVYVSGGKHKSKPVTPEAIDAAIRYVGERGILSARPTVDGGIEVRRIAGFAWLVTPDGRIIAV